MQVILLVCKSQVSISETLQMQETVIERLVDSCTSVKSKYFFNDLNHFALPQIYGVFLSVGDLHISLCALSCH